MQERWNVRAPTWWWLLFWVHRRSRLSLRMSGEVLVLVPIVSSGPLQLHGSEMWLQSRPGRRQTLHRKSKTTFLNPGQESEWWGNFPKFSAALIWKQTQTCCWRADPWTVLQLNDDFMRFHLVCFYFLFLFSFQSELKTECLQSESSLKDTDTLNEAAGEERFKVIMSAFVKHFVKVTEAGLTGGLWDKWTAVSRVLSLQTLSEVRC